MIFFAYNVNVDRSESIWYVLEQYSKKKEQNVGMRTDDGPPAVMHS